MMQAFPCIDINTKISIFKGSILCELLTNVAMIFNLTKFVVVKLIFIQNDNN